jgi:hypothetical protein
MDNFNHDNAEGLAGTAVSLVTGLRESIITKAKRKKAQKISDAGGYFTLSAYQKSLIEIPEYAKKQMATQGTEPAKIQATDALPIQAGQVGSSIKVYLPYIIGAVVLGVVIYFVAKKS